MGSNTFVFEYILNTSSYICMLKLKLNVFDIAKYFLYTFFYAVMLM